MKTIAENDLAHIWQQLSSCISELSESHVFITGGTGFFGCWLLESIIYANKILGLNIKATVLSRNPSKFLHRYPYFGSSKEIAFLEGDIRDFPFIKQQFTHVIHAATDVSSVELIKERPFFMFDSIVQGTQRALDFAIHAQAKKFLLTSSGAVYGKIPTEFNCIPETYLGAPDPLDTAANYATYGIGKRAAEHLCALYADNYGLEIKIARCFALVGPYLPLTTHFAIGNFINNALNQEPIAIKGDGTTFRSYLYAADLIIWLWTILCFGQNKQAYNLGSEEGISIADLAHMIAKQTTPLLPVTIAKLPDSNKAIEKYVPCTAKAQHELGLKQWISLPDAIQRTMQWYSSES